MKQVPLIAAVLGVTILVAALIYFLSSDSVAPVPAEPTSVIDSQESGSEGVDGLAGVAPRELPAAVVALNEQDDLTASAEELLPRMAALEARSRAGDARAALQLHLDLQNCVEQSKREKRIEDLLTQKVGMQESEISTRKLMAEVFAKQHVAAEKACAGISPEAMSNRFAHLERAASLGSEQAQILFRGEGSPVMGDAEAMLRDPEELVRFRRKAAEFTQAAARNCNGMAISLLASDYLNGRFVERNPASAFAMRAVLDRIPLNAPMPPARATEYANGLDSNQLVQAQRQGATFHARYCEGR